MNKFVNIPFVFGVCAIVLAVANLLTMPRFDIWIGCPCLYYDSGSVSVAIGGIVWILGGLAGWVLDGLKKMDIGAFWFAGSGFMGIVMTLLGLGLAVGDAGPPDPSTLIIISMGGCIVNGALIALLGYAIAQSAPTESAVTQF